MSATLTPEKALIFRIVHRDNLPWILDLGLHARNSAATDPNYRNIGNPDLITKRSSRGVPVPPYGTLHDYIPFYFTPHSPMMYNINTGRGVSMVPPEQIVIFVSSLRRLAELGIPFVFTNQHAYLGDTEYFTDLNDLDRIDWGILQARDFQRDPDDPKKLSRYQAEALVWQHIPLSAVLGICCCNQAVLNPIQEAIDGRKLNIRALARPGWYF